jgi:SpoVK/Ycf46/Vps4 family AAA+-type ATPase
MPSDLANESEQRDHLRAFLCHSSADKEIVRDLYTRLKREGFEPWLDEENLLPGQDWELEISKAVRASHVVIVCLSNASTNKEGFIQKEIKYALDVADEKPEGAIFIIPLRLEDCVVPERLRRWHWVNFFDERGYGKLREALIARFKAMDRSKHIRPQKDASKSGAVLRKSTTSKDLHNLLAELDKLVGLQPAKDFISEMVSSMELAERMHSAGFSTKNYPLGFVGFYGNPGTGKTLIARLLGRILAEVGALNKGHMIITSRADLVGMYMGETGPKTRRAIEQSLDGVLFIDEAYTLSSGSDDIFGAEVLTELITQMEIYADRLVVILSGYSHLMTSFVMRNPGLNARINHRVDFPDFTADELLMILKRSAADEGFILSDATALKIKAYFEHCRESRGTGFGNAPEARNLLGMLKTKCAQRILRSNTDIKAKPVIQPEDVPEW